ncbi:hypothetical protein FA95DRAFT_1547240 [Auriscalpium vulgare]|uniref:Uncharacterized protein n=1 Tax=Auriscalpium vulgare TaxID=40419 RepID=A0ACB8RGJ6_9AGAM|nr:hypothetical protein FA95DRAFT_1547240 [Auriscalpium vulgare]
MEAATPKKLVHFAPSPSPSSIGSPFSEGTSSDSVNSSSTLQYVNAQLISHGFTTAPGLGLDGLSNGDSERVVKCLFAMLSQRMEDMNRTEELTTKLRTLSYDHDRLRSLHGSATEKAAAAEREASTSKSKLATATRALQQSEVAHKHTTSELQRTRTTLQGLRSTHQAELKKRDREAERMVEKWSKLSDAQLKLGSIGSGMTIHGANAEVLDSSTIGVVGKGKGLVETALEEAESACKQLREENTELKNLIIDIANAVRKVLHKAVSEDPDDFEFPPPLEAIDLFPLGTPDAAFERLSALLTSLRDSVVALRSQPMARLVQGSDATSGDEHQHTTEATAKRHAADIERLEKTISSLRSDLEKAKSESSAYASQIELLSARTSTPRGSVSSEKENTELEQRRAQLEDEETAFAAAALRLGKEKAELEAERMKLNEEKRAWRVHTILPDTQPLSTSTNRGRATAYTPPLPEPFSPKRSKSPRKPKARLASSAHHSPTKATSRKRTPVFRRSASGSNPSLGAGPSAAFVPAYETEVIPATLASSLLPTSFVLPPPSPHARIPPRTDALLGLPEDAHAAAFSTTPPYLDDRALPPDDSPPGLAMTPETPPQQLPPNAHRPFPMAKPLAQRMVHAYSPARPSPLSRILLLADSPEGGAPLKGADFTALDAVAEEFDEPPPPPVSVPSSDEDDSPLREKQAVGAPAKSVKGRSSGGAGTKPVAEKKKASRTAVPAVEKENTIKRKLKGPATNRASAAAKSQPAPPAAKPAVKSRSNDKLSVSSLMPLGKSGPRRVPIDSAEAAPIVPGWRG